MEKILLDDPEMLHQLDEIQADKVSSDNTLKVAISYHSNSLSRLHKADIKWWQKAQRMYALDPDKEYKVEIRRDDVRIHFVEIDSDTAQP